MFERTFEERYSPKQSGVQEQKSAALQLLHAELTGKLAEIDEKDSEAASEVKKKLVDESDKNKLETNQNFDQMLEQLKTDKKTDIEEAKGKAAESADEVRTVVDECVSKSRADGMSQKMALCRGNAQTIDTYWNGCGLQ